jgi:hypothetical protein
MHCTGTQGTFLSRQAADAATMQRRQIDGEPMSQLTDVVQVMGPFATTDRSDPLFWVLRIGALLPVIHGLIKLLGKPEVKALWPKLGSAVVPILEWLKTAMTYPSGSRKKPSLELVAALLLCVLDAFAAIYFFTTAVVIGAVIGTSQPGRRSEWIMFFAPVAVAAFFLLSRIYAVHEAKTRQGLEGKWRDYKGPRWVGLSAMIAVPVGLTLLTYGINR